jgi:MSHA biogenesis protein MshJ
MNTAVKASGIQAQWQGWSARFAALQQREKIMIVVATLFAILFGGYSVWIEPPLKQRAGLEKALAQQLAEQQQLQLQIVELGNKSNDPDAQNRELLDRLHKELAVSDQDIHGFDRVLLPPAEAPALLQALLARHRGLSLVSLKTLAPQPLVTPPAQKDAKPGAEQAKAAELPGGNIFKHGIEIKISGGYQDLMAYVADLEGGEQKLLWGAMQLVVKEHPVSELTLTVYTLSLESAWLAV